MFDAKAAFFRTVTIGFGFVFLAALSPQAFAGTSTGIVSTKNSEGTINSDAELQLADCGEDEASGEAGEALHESGEDAEHYHVNALEAFLGGTYEDGDEGDESGFTLGLTYERRLSTLIGVGAFWEYAFGDFDKWSLGAPLFIHPYRGFRVALAPGLEHRDGEDEFLFRTGLGYEFELDERWIIMPEVAVDFVDGDESYVFGVSLGYGF